MSMALAKGTGYTLKFTLREFAVSARTLQREGCDIHLGSVGFGACRVIGYAERAIMDENEAPLYQMWRRLRPNPDTVPLETWLQNLDFMEDAIRDYPDLPMESIMIMLAAHLKEEHIAPGRTSLKSRRADHTSRPLQQDEVPYEISRNY